MCSCRCALGALEISLRFSRCKRVHARGRRPPFPAVPGAGLTAGAAAPGTRLAGSGRPALKAAGPPAPAAVCQHTTVALGQPSPAGPGFCRLPPARCDIWCRYLENWLSCRRRPLRMAKWQALRGLGPADLQSALRCGAVFFIGRSAARPPSKRRGKRPRAGRGGRTGEACRAHRPARRRKAAARLEVEGAGAVPPQTGPVRVGLGDGRRPQTARGSGAPWNPAVLADLRGPVRRSYIWGERWRGAAAVSWRTCGRPAQIGVLAYCLRTKAAR